MCREHTSRRRDHNCRVSREHVMTCVYYIQGNNGSFCLHEEAIELALGPGVLTWQHGRVDVSTAVTVHFLRARPGQTGGAGTWVNAGGECLETWSNIVRPSTLAAARQGEIMGAGDWFTDLVAHARRQLGNWTQKIGFLHHTDIIINYEG